MCPTDGRRKLLVERFWYLMGAGVGSTQVLQLPGPWPWSCLVGQLSSFPFFLSLGFSSLSFLPRPAPAFFCCWHEMLPGESAGPNLQTPFIHSTSARGGPWLRTGRGGSRGGVARIWVPCSPEADSAPAEARPAHAAGRLSQRGHVMGDPEEGDGNWATGLRSP